MCDLIYNTGNIVAYVSEDSISEGRYHFYFDSENYNFIVPQSTKLQQFSFDNNLLSSIIFDEYAGNNCAGFHHWVDCLKSDSNICYSLRFDWWYDDDTDACYYDDLIVVTDFNGGAVEEYKFFDGNEYNIDPNEWAGERIPPFFYQRCSERYFQVKAKLDAQGRSDSECLTRTYFNSLTISDALGGEDNVIVLNSRIMYENGTQLVLLRETGDILWQLSPGRDSDKSMWNFQDYDSKYVRPHSSYLYNYDIDENESAGKYELVMFDNQFRNLANGKSRALGLELDTSNWSVKKLFDFTVKSPDGYGLIQEYCYAAIRSSMVKTSRNTYLGLWNCGNSNLIFLTGNPVSVVVEFSVSTNGQVTVINELLLSYSAFNNLVAGPFSITYVESWNGETLV